MSNEEKISELQADVKAHTSAFVLLENYGTPTAEELRKKLDTIGRKKFTVTQYQTVWANVELKQ
jgi:hypothetical protein